MSTVLGGADGVAPSPAWPLGLRRRALLAHHLALLAPSGLRPADLRLLARAGLESPGFSRHLDAIASRLESGEALSDALESMPGSFEPADAALVRAGERSGRLAGALESWAAMLRARAEVGALAGRAALIPAATVVIAAMSWGIVTAKVVPTLATIYLESGAELPRPTQAMIRAGTMTGVALAACAIAALAIAVAWLFPGIVPAGMRSLAHRAMLLMPGTGRIHVHAGRRLALEAIAAGLAAGRPAGAALRDVAPAMRNVRLRAELEAAAARLEAGEAPASSGPLIDGLTAHGLALALRRPDAADAVARLARREELALRRALRRFDALAPPMLTLVAALASVIVLVGTYVMLLATPTLVP